MIQAVCKSVLCRLLLLFTLGGCLGYAGSILMKVVASQPLMGTFRGKCLVTSGQGSGGSSCSGPVPHAGAQVVIQDIEGKKEVAGTKSDTSGMFEFDLKPGYYRIHATPAPGNGIGYNGCIQAGTTTDAIVALTIQLP